jgi:hypothetical protein
VSSATQVSDRDSATDKPSLDVVDRYEYCPHRDIPPIAPSPSKVPPAGRHFSLIRTEPGQDGILRYLIREAAGGTAPASVPVLRVTLFDIHRYVSCHEIEAFENGRYRKARARLPELQGMDEGEKKSCRAPNSSLRRTRVEQVAECHGRRDQ